MERRNNQEIEHRIFDVCELRVEKREDEQRKIVGHAAVFDVVAGDTWFREKIAPGAFTESIGKDDVRALWNHDPNFVLGRNTSKTLTLREDDKGLWVEINPPDTQAARDLMVSIDRGDVSQMSFGFQTLIDEWEHFDDKADLRTLKKVKLWDVSPVTFPFYTQTDVALRSHEQWQKRQMKHPVRRMQLITKTRMRGIQNGQID